MIWLLQGVRHSCFNCFVEITYNGESILGLTSERFRNIEIILEAGIVVNSSSNQISVATKD